MKSIVVGTTDYQELMKPFGEVTHYRSGLLSSISEYDCIVFTGGADIEPTRYGEPAHPKTYFNKDRDVLEFDLFHMAKSRGLKMVGICRGAQLLCVANGDRLIQDVNNHQNRIHNIITDDGKVVEVNGDHHQMMAPDNGKLIAWSVDIANHYHDGEQRMKPFFNKHRRIVEPEAVWYEHTSSLCIQFHPEWSLEKSPARKYFNQLVEEYIL